MGATKSLFLVGLFCHSILSLSAHAQASALSGRYVGIFRHEKLQRDQLAKLDFILSREDNTSFTIKAVLTLHFGDFKSGEYVSYHFEDVKYSVLEKAFIFSQRQQGVTLISQALTPTEFKGEFTSRFSGNVGKLHLRSDKAVPPELPLLEPITGEYRGKCLSTLEKGKGETVVQLYTYRTTEGTGGTEGGTSLVSKNAFRAYNIKGFIGQEYQKRCLHSPNDKICHLADIHSGTYNFFENQLFIYCNVRDMGCIPVPEGLQCERCELLKRTSPKPAVPATTPPVASSHFQPIKADGDSAFTGELSSIRGLYRGYVHHEYLDVYHPAQLNVVSYQTGAPEDPKLNIFADGTLYFGDFGSTEAITYHFAERTYPKPLGVTQFIFDSPDSEANIDAIVQVDAIGDGMVKGVWFSRLFGKVGNFEMYKDKLPEIPAGSHKMGLVAGNYDGSDWEYDILVNLSSAQPNSLNPFAPLTFAGYQFFRGNGQRTRISGGSYDFYTGKIGLEVKEDGERTHIGERLSRKKLLLRTMNRGFLVPLEPFPLRPYRLVGSRD